MNNLVKDVNGFLLTHSHNILNRWKNYSCLLLNEHAVYDARQTEMHTAEPIVLNIVPSSLKLLLKI